MARRILLIVAWVVATFATGMVAWGAVSIAQNRVADTPVRPISAAELATIATDTVAVVGTSTVTDTQATTANAPPVSVTATTTGPTLPATTVPTQPTTPASTSAPTSAPPSTSTSTTSTSTTSTTAVEELVKSAYSMIGGRVVIESRPGEVWLFSLTPNPGFSSEVEKQGPDKVELVFKGDGHESHFEARWDGDELDVSIDEDSDD